LRQNQDPLDLREHEEGSDLQLHHIQQSSSDDDSYLSSISDLQLGFDNHVRFSVHRSGFA